MKEELKTYPEHDKLAKIKDQSQWLGSFLDHMSKKGYFLARYEKRVEEKVLNHVTDKIESQEVSVLTRCNKDINSLLAEYFEIDLVKLEEEKREIFNDFVNRNSHANKNKA